MTSEAQKKIINTADYASAVMFNVKYPSWYSAQLTASEVGHVIRQAVWFACRGYGGPIESLNWARDIGREDHYIAPSVPIMI